MHILIVKGKTKFLQTAQVSRNGHPDPHKIYVKKISPSNLKLMI